MMLRKIIMHSKTSQNLSTSTAMPPVGEVGGPLSSVLTILSLSTARAATMVMLTLCRGPSLTSLTPQLRRRPKSCWPPTTRAVEKTSPSKSYNWSRSSTPYWVRSETGWKQRSSLLKKNCRRRTAHYVAWLDFSTSSRWKTGF